MRKLGGKSFEELITKYGPVFPNSKVSVQLLSRV